MPTVSVTDKVAAKLPALPGENVTAIVQELPAASVDPQVFVLVKAVLLVPVSLIPAIASGALPALASVKIWAALVVPAVTLPKFALAGVSTACGCASAVPVPVSDAVCVPTESVTEKVPL